MNPFTTMDNCTFVIRAKVDLIAIDKKICRLKMEGKSREFWFLGPSRIKVGDYLELHYRLFRIGNYDQAWATNIIELTPKIYVIKACL